MRNALFLLLCACGSDATLAPVVAERLLPAAPAPGASAPARTSGPTSLDAATVDFLPNGNLVVIEPAAAWLFDGTSWIAREFAAETGISLERIYGSPQTLLVVGNKGGWSAHYDSLEVLSSIDLGSLYRGPGRVVDGVVVLPNLRGNGQAPGPNDPFDDAAVVLERAGKPVTLRLPRAAGPTEVAAVRVDGDLAVITWQADTTLNAEAYALDSGARLGEAAPHDSAFPMSSMVGHLQYYIAFAAPPRAAAGASSLSSSGPPPPTPTAFGMRQPMPPAAVGYVEHAPLRALVVRDVQSGVVLRQRAIPCKGQLANPTASPDQGTVLVTCQGTAIVMDGRTLLERRRIKNVIPGCDNGFELSGHIENGGTLVVEGCMGVARLDLGTGRYLCGDSAGVMGGPYEPMSNERFVKPAAPRCSASSDDVSHQLLGSRRNYSYLFEEKTLLGPRQTRIQLEPEAAIPALSAAEDRIAYVNGNTLIVRELPSGKVLDLPGK